MFWGLTPALDFQDEFLKHFKQRAELNILIVGGADARHIIKTLSQLHRYDKVKINFYVTDVCLELTARQLLFLNIALEQPEPLGFIFKTKLFMELYGNTLIRPTIAKCLSLKAKEFVKMITNLDYCYEVMKMVNLDGLKYKERDYLENTFKYWCSADIFYISELWDRRLRQSLGVRYDSRLGVFDWDLHMRLHPAGAKQICAQEYKNWRSSGVAFTWLESEVSKPNRTLVAGVVPSGEKFLHHGYVGDIVSGPFIAYGLDCTDKEMLKKSNNININRATDITEYNLIKLFYELHNQTECKYKLNKNINMGAVITELSEKPVEYNNATEETNSKCDTESKCIEMNNVKINFLSYSLLQHMGHKEKFKNFSNIIYFSGMLTEKLDPDLISYISNSNCLLLIENQKYIPTNRKEQLEEIWNNIKRKMTVVKNATVLTFDPNEDCYAKFIIENNEMVQSM